MKHIARLWQVNFIKWHVDLSYISGALIIVVDLYPHFFNILWSPKF